MCDKHKYKGITVYHNYSGSRFGTDYWTAANEHIIHNDGTNPHVHSCTRNSLYYIIDAYTKLRSTGQAGAYPRAIRNKALRLADLYIKS
jgi:hypothetical protein